MLGQLGLFRRRCQRVTQSFSLRGIATHQQGRRPVPAPPVPPPPPEKIEWWSVDGELFKAEKFDAKRVLAPLENEHIPNRKRRKERIKYLGQTRLKLRVHNQERYWAAYMKRYQIMRDEWEKHVWDPKPLPTPKPRNSSWLAEEREKYVWRDPRREAHTFDVSRDSRRGAYTFDVSGMDRSATLSRFDKKIGYKGQAMNRPSFDSQRDPGGASVRPGMTPMRRDSYKDSRDQGAFKDGWQRNTDIGSRNSRQIENEDFNDVFDNREVGRSRGNVVQHGVQSARHQQASLSTEDDSDDSEGLEFNWDGSDSEDEERDRKAGEEDGDDDDDDDDDDDEDDEDEVYEDQSQSTESRPIKKGWFGAEDDLFKDED